MQVDGIMQAIKQGIRELCRLLELRWFSNRECVSYIGVWNDVGFQSGTHELRIANYVGRFELCRFPIGNSRIMQVAWNCVGFPAGNSRVMQVFGIMQVPSREFSRIMYVFGLMQVFQNREFANYVGVWIYVGFPLGNSRVMQVFGIMQVSNRELANYVGFWNYIVCQAGNSRIMQVYGSYVGFRIQQGIRELCRFWSYVGFQVGNS